MRREMIWAGGLLVGALAVTIGAQAAESAPVKVESGAAEGAVILLDDMSPDRLFRLPGTYTVKKRYPDGHPQHNALAGAPLGCAGLDVETKEIYTSKGGLFAFRPGRGSRVADDLVTELFRDCSICSLEVRVTGGVEHGGGEFRADIELYDGCPFEGGSKIPGSLVQYTGLDDDLGQFHDLVLDYSDRGMCDDGVCPSGEACQVALQDCMAGSCGDGTACDPDEEACSDGSECADGTCEDQTPCAPVCADGTQCTAHAAGLCEDDSACDPGKQACLDGSKCRDGTCSDGALCQPNRPPCADATLCVGGVCGDGTACPPLICRDGSTCVKSECVGDPCSVSQQNCSAGICTDGSSCDLADPNCGDNSECQPTFVLCVEDPLQIPATVWIRLRFDTDDAAVVMGETPTRGFSADAYDDLHGNCTSWFAGWPAFPHATFFATILAPADCDTHFLAYLAANPNKPPFVPGDLGPVIGPDGVLRPPQTNPTTRLGDDITLAVDNCILSAYELGMKGTAGAFTMDIDLRWPHITDIRADTVREFHGRGDGGEGGAAEVGHFTIDEDVNLSITANDQPIFITWASNRTNTGAMEVNINQAGTSGPFMLAFDVDPLRPYEWVIASDGDNTPAVFYAAIFCRGETPRGACCPDQPDTPGSELNCFDNVPVTSCLGGRWLAHTTCVDSLFDPPCGTHACCLADGSCDNLVRAECLMICDHWPTPTICWTDKECPAERTCTYGDGVSGACSPVCAKWSTGKFCRDADFECPQPCEIGDITTIFFADSLEIDPPGAPILNCAIDAGQPHDLNDTGLALGWDRMVMEFTCNAATLPWSRYDFQATSTSGNIWHRPKSIVYDDIRARLSVVLYDPIAPGEWTCIEHLDSGQRWCAGSLPGDADQNRLVTTGDISALINAINIPPSFRPPLYATDINRSGLTTAVDILRLIDLLNGAGDFEPWITRSLPPCPLEP